MGRQRWANIYLLFAVCLERLNLPTRSPSPPTLPHSMVLVEIEPFISKVPPPPADERWSTRIRLVDPFFPRHSPGCRLPPTARDFILPLPPAAPPHIGLSVFSYSQIKKWMVQLPPVSMFRRQLGSLALAPVPCIPRPRFPCALCTFSVVLNRSPTIPSYFSTLPRNQSSPPPMDECLRHDSNHLARHLVATTP